MNDSPPPRPPRRRWYRTQLRELPGLLLHGLRRFCAVLGCIALGCHYRHTGLSDEQFRHHAKCERCGEEVYMTLCKSPRLGDTWRIDRVVHPENRRLN